MTARERKIEIDVGSGRIAGTLITPGVLLPGVLFVHGWGGSQEQYLTRAREVAALGSVCLTFDLGGHAGTQPQRETVSRESNLRDLLAAYDALAAHPDVDPACIAVVGSSYGGYLAAILTTLRSVDWLALRAPALYIDTGWELPKLQLHKEHDLRAYRLSFIAAASNRALRACVDFKGDVLVVQSGHDDFVPPAVIRSYREAFVNARSLTYRCMADADHGLSDDAGQRAYSGLLVQWLGEMFAGSRRAAPAGPPPAAAARADSEPEAPPKAS
jgi:dienelactone hydrolase